MLAAIPIPIPATEDMDWRRCMFSVCMVPSLVVKSLTYIRRTVQCSAVGARWSAVRSGDV